MPYYPRRKGVKQTSEAFERSLDAQLRRAKLSKDEKCARREVLRLRSGLRGKQAVGSTESIQ